MIHIVTTRDHRYTTRHLARSLAPHIKRWTYENLFLKRRVSAGTWIFTDHERLGARTIELATAVADRIAASGGSVLNHPAKVLRRYDLQQALVACGINHFRTYRAKERPSPTRFPVFLRGEADHDGSIGGLIEGQDELDHVLASLAGASLDARLVVEYAGEEVEPGIWHRFAAYRVGDAIIPHHKALDRTWQVKDGFDAARLSAYPNGAAFVAGERKFVVEGEHIETLRAAFRASGIEYGRADFALRNGSPEIFEINTNPYHARPSRLWRDMHPDRKPTQRYSEERIKHALLSLDTPDAAEVVLNDPVLRPLQSILPFRLTRFRLL